MRYITNNLSAVRREIVAAEQRVGREGRTRMLAAVKYGSDEELGALLASGVTEVGENRVQQLLAHWSSFEAYGTKVHFIGSLQTNKVKYIIDKVAMIHSVDSLRLAEVIDRQAAQHELCMDVLVEINSGCEESKSGLAPDEVEDFCLELAKFPHINLRGFMTMAPKCEKNEDYRKYFQKTYKQCLDIWQKKLHNIGSPILSMGMSDSFEAAIEEGSDIVRIGRALFQPR